MSSLGSILLLDSPNLILSHPTPSECQQISQHTAASWSDSLPLSEHLKESYFLTTVTLARQGGMTIWILTDKDRKPDERRILVSCESFRKRALVSNKGDVKEEVVHDIASVFCHPNYRGFGYGKRMMRALAKRLATWQADGKSVAGSVLYSYIGKMYYAQLGWEPNVTNPHVEFRPQGIGTFTAGQRDLRSGHIDALCERRIVITEGDDQTNEREARGHHSGC